MGEWIDWPTGPGLWWCRRTDTMKTFICWASADADAHGGVYMRGLIWEDGSPVNALHKPSRGWVFARASPEITYAEALEVIRRG